MKMRIKRIYDIESLKKKHGFLEPFAENVHTGIIDGRAEYKFKAYKNAQQYSRNGNYIKHSSGYYFFLVPEF